MGKARLHKVAVVEAASAAALTTAVNAVLVAYTEEQLVDIIYMAYDATHYSAMIVYTE